MELCTFAGVNEIAVCEHGGSAADRRTVHDGDERLVEADERLYQVCLGALGGPGGVVRKSARSFPDRMSPPPCQSTT